MIRFIKQFFKQSFFICYLGYFKKKKCNFLLTLIAKSIE